MNYITKVFPSVLES